MDLIDGYVEDLHVAKETRCMILSPQSNVLLSGQLVLALVCNPELKNQWCYNIFRLQTNWEHNCWNLDLASCAYPYPSQYVWRCNDVWMFWCFEGVTKETHRWLTRWLVLLPASGSPFGQPVIDSKKCLGFKGCRMLKIKRKASKRCQKGRDFLNRLNNAKSIPAIDGIREEGKDLDQMLVENRPYENWQW